MSAPLTIGIVDYGVGNLASVRHALHALDLRCRVSDDPGVLDATDVVLLPGVGAFPAAMAALTARGLDGFLQARSATGRPVLGICLGMQLLAQASLEHQQTRGLGLVQGTVRPLQATRWHIGWNTLEIPAGSDLLQPFAGEAVYFNHAYALDGAADDCAATAAIGPAQVCAAVRRGPVVGLQFHPERSQVAGRRLLRHVITELCA